jgi:hypothetical protein
MCSNGVLVSNKDFVHPSTTKASGISTYKEKIRCTQNSKGGKYVFDSVKEILPKLSQNGLKAQS